MNQDLQKLNEFVNFLMTTIQYGSGSVAGLMATIHGYKLLTSSPESVKFAKDGFKNLFWGLTTVFGASYVVKFFVGKLTNLF